MENLSTFESIPIFNEKSSIKVYINRRHESFAPHWHEHLELFYFLEGFGTYTCNGNTFWVKKGDMIVVNPTEIHAFSAHAPTIYGCVLFYPSFFWDTSFDQSILMENFISGDSYTQDLLTRIFEEQTQKDYGYDIMLKGLCSTLLCYLMRKYPGKQKSVRRTSDLALRKEHLLFDHIANHYRENLTTSSLAKFCHIDESYFCRFFKKNFGRTPMTYLNEYRVEKSIRLLRDTPKTITEIALEVGFTDGNYFSRTFKKIKGITPSKFREQYETEMK